MIAQVFRMSGPPPGAQPSEEMQGIVRDTAKRQGDVEGCEGILMMRNPATGENLHVTLWRDEAAMKAGARYQDEEIANAKKRNPSMEVPAPTIFEVFAHA
jgi:heme-degrading monooxygenase HmoA